MAVDHYVRTIRPIQHSVLDAVLNERDRQDALKAAGKFLYTCADPQMLSAEKCLVLTEECGEVARAVLNLHHFSRDYGADLGRVREELVQVAAVAVAWLEFIESVLSPVPGMEPGAGTSKEGETPPDLSASLE
jgi:NTP pyrophosphatase (non-canonical NTP hydrolase)